MKDKDKSKEQLLKELALLRPNLSEFEQTEASQQSPESALSNSEADTTAFLMESLWDFTEPRPKVVF